MAKSTTLTTIQTKLSLGTKFILAIAVLSLTILGGGVMAGLYFYGQGDAASPSPTQVRMSVLKMLNENSEVRLILRPDPAINCNTKCAEEPTKTCVRGELYQKAGETRDLEGGPLEVFTTIQEACDYVKPNGEAMSCLCVQP